MRVTVAVADSVGAGQRSAVRQARLGALLRRCGDELGLARELGLTLRLSDDTELARLNAGFRGVAGATDVLAFAAGEPGYLGDVAISVERALAQAEDGVAELRLLAVHGLLHCLGHDHTGRTGAARMTALTRRLLPDQAVPDVAPTDAARAR